MRVLAENAHVIPVDEDVPIGDDAEILDFCVVGNRFVLVPLVFAAVFRIDGEDLGPFDAVRTLADAALARHGVEEGTLARYP